MCFDQGIKLRLNRNESQFLDHPLDAAIQFNVVDTNFDLTSIILKQASQRGLLKKPFKWLTFGILAAIENIDFYPGTDSEFMVIEKYGNEYFFTAIHKVNGNMQTFYHNKIGSWNEKIGVVHYEVLSFYTKRRNLNGSEFPLSFWASNRITYDTVGEYSSDVFAQKPVDLDDVTLFREGSRCAQDQVTTLYHNIQVSDDRMSCIVS
ncbi:hypothetical protein HHI36_008518 [Cryptolaemus montrouzieri]|uniref:Uncharacterized protein n=1 Tax=Cryptolaemus montrouzieri TaxID=559131 RepID=A0ABD2MSN6_9CUCU